jgi:hypothetical protein
MPRWAVLAACCGALALAPSAPATAQTAITGTPQSLFTHEIATDPGTASDMRAALKARRVFVDEDIAFADLTGDGRQDAVVRVDSGGAGGAIAVYVYSSHGGKKLHAIYRNQHLFRAMAAINGATVLLTTPRYEAGDELCCPRDLLERTMTWSERAGRLVVRSTRVVTPM